MTTREGWQLAFHRDLNFYKPKYFHKPHQLVWIIRDTRRGERRTRSSEHNFMNMLTRFEYPNVIQMRTVQIKSVPPFIKPTECHWQLLICLPFLRLFAITGKIILCVSTCRLYFYSVLRTSKVRAYVSLKATGHAAYVGK